MNMVVIDDNTLMTKDNELRSRISITSVGKMDKKHDLMTWKTMHTKCHK